jgi:hypothetical protein
MNKVRADAQHGGHRRRFCGMRAVMDVAPRKLICPNYDIELPDYLQ